MATPTGLDSLLGGTDLWCVILRTCAWNATGALDQEPARVQHPARDTGRIEKAGKEQQ